MIIHVQRRFFMTVKRIYLLHRKGQRNFQPILDTTPDEG
jgi:hypothetical protein